MQRHLPLLRTLLFIFRVENSKLVKPMLHLLVKVSGEYKGIIFKQRFFVNNVSHIYLWSLKVIDISNGKREEISLNVLKFYHFSFTI